MQITVLGAAREVGRSGFLVKSREGSVLLDYGVQIYREPAFPIHVKPKDVDAILLTHAHLDHSGATPIFFLSNGVKVFTTGLTAELTKLLIQDFLKISGFYLPFEYIELMAMMNSTQRVDYDERVQINGVGATFLEAGHIPGGASIIVEVEGKRLLYTGDMNSQETLLLRGANTDFGDLDVVISESTYASSDHPSLEEVMDDFIAFARETVEGGGILLVPAFSVGRAQEMACVLKKKAFPYPVAMDGMALDANGILFRYQEYLRDPDLFRKAIDNVEVITSWSQRKRMAKTPSVIISPAGMLVGGAAVFYNSEIATNPKNAIAIVAFQTHGTPGRTLLEKGVALVKGRTMKVRAEVRRFDFSSHSGRRELLEMFKAMKGSPKVFTIHGEEESCVGLAEELREGFGLDAVAPKAGDTFSVE